MRAAPRYVAIALAGLAIHGLLAGGAFAAAPVALRIAFAFTVLVLLPGHAILAGLDALPPGGAWLATGWALGPGVAWFGAQVLLTRALHVPFTVLAAWTAVPNALLWAWPALRAPRRPPEPRPAAALSGIAVAAILAAALVACVHVARVPTPLNFYTDSPDHIGTIRRMMAEGDAFPEDAFFRDAGHAGADPRKGLWHPEVATIATLARADAVETWCALAALLAPLFALNAAGFGWLVAGGAGAAVAAWALVLTYGGSLASPYLREAVFATKLADQLALATAAAVLADLDERRRRSRLAAIALALGAVAAHVFAALQFAVVFGALGVGLLVRERGPGERFRRLAGTALALGAACLPYLLWRAHGSYAPANVIHTEPQGLLQLTDRLRVVSIGALGSWFGWLWLIVPCWLVAWWRASARPAVLYLLTTTVAVGLLLFCPPVVGLLQPRLGYLLMRFVWLVPLPAVFAFALPALGGALRSGPALRRMGAAAALLGIAALGAPVLLDAGRVLAHPEAERRGEALASVLRWRDAMEWMDLHLPAGSVVLSDPATSYAVPMLTRHWVTTLVDQHSSPNDSLALARILDARDALDPSQSYARTRAVVRRWGATAIALNDRFHETPRLDYWAPQHAWYVRARARLDAAPAAFARVFDSGDFVVYRIRPQALDTLSGGAQPRPYLRDFDPARDPAPRAVSPASPDLLALRLDATQVAAGDTVGAVIEWTATRPLPAGSYSVAVRFDTSLPGGFAPPAWCAKPARKLLEELRHERYRFRDDHLPVGGDFGVDLWRPGQVVRDSFALAVPVDVAPGRYHVQVVMLRQPHYANLRLSDYFFDRDYYSGVPAGTLQVAARRARR